MHKKGFTLVELSIVLVIIGLLIGGILVAQSMISTAKQQTVIKDISQMKVMSQNFLTTYKCLPGDCNLATFAANLRGDNDGMVGYYGEAGILKNQLAQSNFYSTAENLSSCITGIAWENVPKVCFFKGGLQNSIMMVNSTYTVNCGGADCDLGYGPRVNKVSGQHGNNYILYGHNRDVGGGNENFAKPQGLFPPTLALAIDKKVDDGMPNTGNILGWVKYPNTQSPPGGYDAKCVTPYTYGEGAYSTTAMYDTTETTESCGLAFLLGKFTEIDTSF